MEDKYGFSDYICGTTGLICCGCSLFCEHRKEKQIGGRKNMRLIDADRLEKLLQDAIDIQVNLSKNLGIEDDERVQMELKAYRDILQGIKEMPTIANKNG